MRWDQIAAGHWRTCGIQAGTGTVYCWGGPEGRRLDLSMQTLDLEIPVTLVPLAIPAGAKMTTISVGESPLCALTANGEAYCAGRNTRGQVGDGTTTDRRGFEPVSGGHRWQSITTGSSHVCAVTISGQAFCWGNGFRGMLGNGVGEGFPVALVPSPVLTDLRFNTIAAGIGHTCALDTSGRAWCWGSNDYGSLGDGAPPAPGTGQQSAVPSKVYGDQAFVDLYAGGHHFCALDAQRRAFCWGWNRFHQLGDGSGDTISVSVPTAMVGSHRWKRLLLGQVHSCGINESDDLYCWGLNDAGQFGDGTTTLAPVPRFIRSMRPYQSLSTGAKHMCAITKDGFAFCWGRGTQGQLGNGVKENRLQPSAVAPPER